LIPSCHLTVIWRRGAVIQNGPATTLLSAQNSYSGGTTLKDGTLDVGALNGAGTGAITFKVRIGYPADLDAPLCVDILDAGRRIGCALANIYRGDLATAGIGHGRYGFELALPADVDPATVEVRCTIADTTLPLTRGRGND
jgi:autotransporter-associated beta strand protein